MKSLTVNTKEQVREMFAQYPTVLVNAQPDPAIDQDSPSKTQYHTAHVLSKYNRTYRGVEKIFIDVSSDMVAYISTLANVRLCDTIPGPSFDRFSFYCLRDLFMPNDLSINRGFPEGMTYKDLRVGAVVSTCWLDSPVTNGLVIDVDPHVHNYKGERSFKTLDASGSIQRCVHTQIVELVERDVLSLLTNSRKHVDALLAIEQIAQGQANKKLRQVCDIASAALGTSYSDDVDTEDGEA